MLLPADFAGNLEVGSSGFPKFRALFFYEDIRSSHTSPQNPHFFMRFLDNWKTHQPLDHSLACPCVWKLGQALFCGDFWGMGRHEAVLAVGGIKSHLVSNAGHLE